ncbi:MAG: TatD family hydrolase [Bacteroidetes bacterium]|nr:TatD family hydrolase [Bacteroidota bacterium]
MVLIDTHTHVFHKEFDADLDEMVERSRAAGVSHMLLPNINLESVERLHAVCSHFPGYCLPMMGLHPCDINEDWKNELDSIGELLHGGKYCAVGEIGLDRHWDLTHYEAQTEALRIQFQWALDLNLPVSIHSRKAIDETMSIAEPYMRKGLKAVLHCFGGSAQQAMRAVDMGFFLGVGGVITYHNSNLHEVLAPLSPERLVLETDAPYLSPVPYRGKRNEPTYLKEINAKLAAALGITEETCAEITTANARLIFHIND